MADKPKGKGKASSMNHGMKSPGKCANKYDGWGTTKGKKAKK